MELFEAVLYIIYMFARVEGVEILCIIVNIMNNVRIYFRKICKDVIFLYIVYLYINGNVVFLTSKFP